MFSRILLSYFAAQFLSIAGPVSLSLDSVAAHVRSGNPDLRAARMRIDEARGRLLQSGRLSNPEIEFGYMRNTSAPREHSLEVSVMQRFPVTSRLRHEKAVSRAQLAAAQAEVREVERKLVAEARAAAVRVLAIQGQRDLRTKQLSNSREQASFLRKRTEAGEASEVDTAQVELETRALEVEMLQLDAERTRLLGELRLLLGIDGDVPIAFSGGLAAPSTTPPADPSARPDVQAAQFNAEAARAEAARERASRIEDVSVGLVYERVREDDAPEGLSTDQLVGLKVSVPLPLWNPNRGRIQQAEAAAARAHLETEAVRFRANAELAAVRAEMAALAKLIEDFDARLLPKAAELEERLRQTYSAGQSSLTDSLRARDRHLQLQRQRLDALRDYHLARVRWEAATVAMPAAGKAVTK